MCLKESQIMSYEVIYDTTKLMIYIKKCLITFCILKIYI